MARGKPLIDMTGKRVGRLTVLELGEKKGKYTGAFWKCKCDCGRTVTVPGRSLRNGETRSCGCLHSDMLKKAPQEKHTGTRLYAIWQGMKQRTMQKNNPRYADYGGRGITVCPEWRDSYENFRDWALANGYSDELSIDRKDVNGNYEPSNCRWATDLEQGNNTRRNRILEYNGETHTLTEWAQIKGMKLSTLSARINSYGWTIEKALSEPLHEEQKRR